MTVINYVLYLVITLMILYPFVLFTSASVFTMYFKCKEEHNKKMVALFGKAVSEVGNAMKIAGAMAKKEKEEQENG